MKTAFLFMGILLSVGSKVLQFRFDSIWGDYLVLPAATFFTLAILMYNKTFVIWFHNRATKQLAIQFAVGLSLFVLFFQLFTMITFGKSLTVGYLLIIPLSFAAMVTSILYRRLRKEK